MAELGIVHVHVILPEENAYGIMRGPHAGHTRRHEKMSTTDGQGAILYCERVESRKRYFFFKLKAVHYSSVAMSMDALSERYSEFLVYFGPVLPIV